MEIFIYLFLLFFIVFPLYLGYYLIYKFFSGYRFYNPKHELDLFNDDSNKCS